MLGSDFRTQINGYSAGEIASQRGSLVWQGNLETPSALNQDVTTAIPVDEAMGKLEARPLRDDGAARRPPGRKL